MSLHTFLQRPYWSRLWIIQEVALAPKNMLMFVGEDSITWQEIYDGLGVIHTTHWYVKDACLQNDRRVDRMIRGLIYVFNPFREKGSVLSDRGDF
jgi:hypothetical protein